MDIAVLRLWTWTNSKSSSDSRVRFRTINDPIVGRGFSTRNTGGSSMNVAGTIRNFPSGSGEPGGIEKQTSHLFVSRQFFSQPERIALSPAPKPLGEGDRGYL